MAMTINHLIDKLKDPLISVTVTASKILGKLEAKNWLYRKIRSLGNEIPINLLDTEAGHRMVIQTLLHFKYGIYN